jgi:sugar-phosphatase
MSMGSGHLWQRELATARLIAVGLPIPKILVTADDVTFGKPHPEPYERACRELGVSPAECIVVEDAPAGIVAAKGAGMTVLAVTTTHAAVSLQHADLVLSTLTEVTQRLRASRT